MKRFFLYVLFSLLLASCTTLENLEPQNPTEAVEGEDTEGLLVEDTIQEVDIESAVVYVETPVYYPSSTPEKPEVKVTGTDAVKKNLETVSVLPEYVDGRPMKWRYHPDAVYIVECQTYHSTDIQLEPGEKVLETPYISEPDVWQIGAGVSISDGLPVQHFIVKPDYSGLSSNMIIITDRRVYHLELKSTKDRYIPIIRWSYPQKMSFTIAGASTQKNEMTEVNPAFLSFDYTMKYSIFKKPSWLPKQVYDDGRKTYIVLDEKILHTELPVLVNKKNEIINYRVQKNILIIDQLIESVTLKLGNVKVMIEKKKAVVTESQSSISSGDTKWTMKASIN